MRILPWLFAAFFIACAPGEDASFVPDAGDILAEADIWDGGQPAEDTFAPDVTVIPPEPAPFRVATWNLDNFSAWGENENRLSAIAEKIVSMDADVIAVQELKPAESTNTKDAFDALLEILVEYDGFHADWQSKDTSVGFLYRTSTTSVVGYKTIFPDDWFAFPRPPLVATFVVNMGEQETTFTAINLHLKAFQDGADRRKDACTKLDAYIRAQSSTDYLVIGDLNDDPHDTELFNVFLETFLKDDGFYNFLTAVLPPETVTSTGWFHMVDGQKIDGEFLDHVVTTTAFSDRFASWDIQVESVPENQYESWISTHSDHFPVWVDFVPPASNEE